MDDEHVITVPGTRGSGIDWRVHATRPTPYRASVLRAVLDVLAGARLGRRVYVNSLAVTDYSLLDFGDDVVIGDGVHLSGHTVEHGVLKTGPSTVWVAT